MNNITMKMNADELILQALREDITSEDITTNSVMPHYQAGEVDLICKQDGVIAGLGVFARVFALLDPATVCEFTCKDGDTVRNGEVLGTIRGDIRVLLSGERTALNFLQRMSGIATYTQQPPLQPERRRSAQGQPHRRRRRRSGSRAHGESLRAVCAQDRDRGGKPRYAP